MSPLSITLGNSDNFALGDMSKVVVHPCQGTLGNLGQGT